MINSKILLRTDRTNKKGEAPVNLRLIQGKKTKFIGLGISVHPKYFNEAKSIIKDTHINANTYNNIIRSITAKLLKIIDLYVATKMISNIQLNNIVILLKEPDEKINIIIELLPLFIGIENTSITIKKSEYNSVNEWKESDPDAYNTALSKNLIDNLSEIYGWER